MKAEAFAPAAPDPAMAEAVSTSDATEQTFQGWLSRYTPGLTPAGLLTAYMAWAPAALGNDACPPREDAPGLYVHQR